MQRWIPEPGQVVRATAGRDAGAHFAVVGLSGSDLLLADGKRRKMSAPKRKNPLHVSATKHRLVLEGLTDKALRTALAPLNETVRQPQSKRNEVRLKVDHRPDNGPGMQEEGT